MRVRYIIGPDASVDSNDRGLAYGDGLFETMAIRRGRVLRLDLHLDRLELGSERLRIPLPGRDELGARIDALAGGVADGLLKLILTRGSGPRGYAPPSDPEPLILLSALPQRPAAAVEIAAVTLTQRLSENEKLAEIKHLCRLEQVLGQLELAGHDADEGIMLSTSGHVIGGTSRNLFAVVGSRLLTPDLSLAGIAGVMRRWILEQCPRLGIAAETTGLLPQHLAAADELFMSNALVGIQSVARLDGRRLRSRTLADAFRAALAANDDA